MIFMQAWRSYEQGNIVQVIDPTIIETCDETQVLRCIHVGFLCTQVESSYRPPMSRVTLMLSTDSVTELPDPTRPAFVNSHISRITKPTASSFVRSSPHTAQGPPSNATASISDLVPR